MSTKIPNNTIPATVEEIHALLERCLIEEYLKSKGHTKESLKSLPKNEADQILREASTFASGKLAEIEIRAHFADDLHGAGHSIES